MDITPDEIKYQKLWFTPKPKKTYYTDMFYSELLENRNSQQKFYDEYFPTGHAINDTSVFPDIPIIDQNGKTVDYHQVNRIAVPYQKMSIDIILAHLLGNKTQFADATVGENKAELISQYKEYWEQKNMEVMRNKLIKSVLTVGDGAVLFYKKENVLKWKVLSFLDKEQIYVKNDKFGEMQYFARYYSQNNGGVVTSYCDILDDTDYTTFVNAEGGWSILESSPHGFLKIPVVYKIRKEGAFWTPAQELIDNLEVMMSRLSEDNRTKAKARLYIKTDDPAQVQTKSVGATDLFVTGEHGDVKLLSGADISTQFKYEYEMLTEEIEKVLGFAFPKHKSSGDMPTTSMKLMFYPTERIVLQLIIDFAEMIDEINDLFKFGMIAEHPEIASELLTLKVSATIKLFTPQDDSSISTMVGSALTMGQISVQTASENTPIAANDEFKRITDEKVVTDAAAAKVALAAKPVVVQSADPKADVPVATKTAKP